MALTIPPRVAEGWARPVVSSGRRRRVRRHARTRFGSTMVDQHESGGAPCHTSTIRKILAAKLREVVTRYVDEHARTAAAAATAGVAFDPDARLAEHAAQRSGWLRGRSRGRAPDGATAISCWRTATSGTADSPDDEVGGLDQPGPSPALDAAVARWLQEPNDDLVTLLAKSLADARMGGTGWLADGGTSRRGRRRPPCRPRRRTPVPSASRLTPASAADPDSFGSSLTAGLDWRGARRPPNDGSRPAPLV